VELASVEVQTGVLVCTGVDEGIATSVEVINGVLLARAVDDCVLSSGFVGTVVAVISKVEGVLPSLVVPTAVVVSTGVL
jgi:hypothetical protein